MVTIYTDGSCLKNPGGPGGYGSVLRWREHEKEVVGAEASTTNNRMELMAAIAALEALTRPSTVILHSDSQYVVNGASEWLSSWKKRGWKKGRETIANVDLWKRLDQVMQGHAIEWRWVRGHNGNPLNERCDQLAYEAAQSIAKKIGWCAS